MSTIKSKFNIGTAAMFLGCLALAIVITQPILARADDEGGGNGDTPVDLEYSFPDAKSIYVDTLEVSDEINIGDSISIGDTINVGDSISIGGNSMVLGDSEIKADGQFCNNQGVCLSIDGDTIHVDKLQIGEGEEGSAGNLVISGDKVIYYDVYSNESTESYFYDFIDTLNLDSQIKMYDYISKGALGGELENHNVVFSSTLESTLESTLKDQLQAYDLITTDNESNESASRKAEGRGGSISFKNDSEQALCSEPESAGTMHYVENASGSQLIMCMQGSDGNLSSVVIKDNMN